MQIESGTKLMLCHTINLPALAVDHYDDEMRQSLAKVYKDFLEKHGYYKERQIATGVYGKIVTAHSIHHKKSVAIKIMGKLETRDVDDLYRELSILKGLTHPNVIKFYESFDTMFQLYVVMEYIQNGTLAGILAKVKYLNEAKAQFVYCQLIEALEYCHSRGVVHLDIKSNNLLLDENLNLKICDFGSARANMFDRKQFLTNRCASGGYSCLEILVSKPYQPHYADIWVSGVVLFEMLYGVLPFKGSGNIELIRQIHNGIRFPNEPLVSGMCKELINRVLAEYHWRIGILAIKKLPWISSMIDKSGG
ncbi:testis-specific serine/threonine-protein kinase 3-like [Bradysia coprophila]|uniref:testis-specific serine/threonine-protein kinase 3-like n=1 Tax=Bradysia coprophila TaxID=38358 RepID=UPI00187D9279|nr:testis-specific serine/threonine-protein kinase 3-like [Bradysia coprophila]